MQKKLKNLQGNLWMWNKARKKNAKAATYSEYEEDFLMDMDTTLRGRAAKLYEKAEKGKEIVDR